MCCDIRVTLLPRKKPVSPVLSGGRVGEISVEPRSVDPRGPHRAYMGLELVGQFMGILELSGDVWGFEPEWGHWTLQTFWGNPLCGLNWGQRGLDRRPGQRADTGPVGWEGGERDGGRERELGGT